MTAAYDLTEEPTRPDLPLTAARKCVHCRLVYGDHVQGTRPQNRLACGGLRRDYQAEQLSEADHVR